MGTRRSIPPVRPTAPRPERDRALADARAMLAALQIRPQCVVFTVVPYPFDNPETFAQALAQELGVSFVVPDVPDLQTIDGYHLDRNSAERWSGRLLDMVDPVVRSCAT